MRLFIFSCVNDLMDLPVLYHLVLADLEPPSMPNDLESFSCDWDCSQTHQSANSVVPDVKLHNVEPHLRTLVDRQPKVVRQSK